MPLNLAEPIKLYIAAARSPPASEPACSQFLKQHSTNSRPICAARIALRSKTPDLVRQEFYGLLMPTLRCASCAANSPPSTLFPPVQRKAFHEQVLQEILQERVACRRGRRNPRGVKKK